MYSSLLVALFLISGATADGPINPNPAVPASVPAKPNPTTTTPPNPTTTTSNPTGTNPNSTATTPNPPAPAIAVKCNSVYFAFSQQEMAEMAASDSPNATATADISKLSTVKEAVLCQDGELASFCPINSCQGGFPVCQQCVEYTPNADDNGGTLGTQIVPSVTCTDNYNFNATAQPTPYLCGVSTKEYSCKTCSGVRDCSTCYDVNKLPEA